MFQPIVYSLANRRQGLFAYVSPVLNVELVTHLTWSNQSVDVPKKELSIKSVFDELFVQYVFCSSPFYTSH